MIDKSCGFYCLFCDICDEEADDSFYEFHDAVEYKKQNGWKSMKINGQWQDICPDCQQKED